MGHGIAQVAAAAGYQVILRDVDDQSLARGRQAIERNLAKGVQLGKVSEADRAQTLAQIKTTTRLPDLAAADLIIEAVPENLELKQKLLRECAAVLKSDYILASNTSSLSITEIAHGVADPARVVGMHFFNPVHVMRLVELVVGEQTSEATINAVRAVAQRMQKEPITVRDVPGFASSRLGVTLGLEAMRSVCTETLLVTNQVSLRISVLHRSPLATFEGMTDLGQWWVPNPLGNRRIVESAGFDIERESGIFAVPFGAGHTPRRGGARALSRRLARRLLSGGDGVPHHAVLATPAVEAPR